MARPHDTMMNPAIEHCSTAADSKFTLVTLAAKRARQINSYFNQLGEGLGAIVPPQVASVVPQAAVDRLRGDRGRQDHLRSARPGRRRRGRLEAASTSTRSAEARRPRSTRKHRVANGGPDRAPHRPRGHRRHRRLQGDRGVPPPRRRRRARRPGHDPRRARASSVSTTFSALASEPVHTSLWDDGDPIPHTRLGQARRPRRRRARDGPVPRRVRRRPLATTCSTADAARHAGAGDRVPGDAHRDVGARRRCRRTCATLRRRGVHVVDPESGRLAGGDIGVGPPRRAPRRSSSAVAAACSRRRTWPGCSVLVTAGGTREPIDPVRVIANRSSGKQGHALADEAAARGAEGHRRHDRPAGRCPRASRSSRSRPRPRWSRRCWLAAATTDVVVMAAAVADFRPKAAVDHKIKKDGGVARDRPRADARHPRRPRRGASARVRRSSASRPRPTTVARTPRASSRRKGLDLIVANDVSAPGVGLRARHERGRDPRSRGSSRMSA